MITIKQARIYVYPFYRQQFRAENVQADVFTYHYNSDEFKDLSTILKMPDFQTFQCLITSEC